MLGARQGTTGVAIHLNNHAIMQNWDSTYNEDEYITNSVILELQEGDEIHLVLPRGFSVYDNMANGTTFSGALLFTL